MGDASGSARHVAFFYDIACPFAYLASTQIEEVCRSSRATLTYRPFLLGGVFRAIGSPDVPMTAMSPAKARHNRLDMERWAAHFGVPFAMPETHPNRTVLALRAILASGDIARATHALFRAYWVLAQDVSQPEVVRAALDHAGLDGASSVRMAETLAIKDDLRARTDEAIAAGVFGAPAFVVTTSAGSAAGELFWGQDRLAFVQAALSGEHASTTSDGARAAPPAPSPSSRSFSFFFDFSSPFAYLASTQVRRLARETASHVELHPFLLGALFKTLGTPNVPLFAMPEPKRRYYLADLERWARHYGVPFAFPTRFPMNTVSPLRMLLAAPVEARWPLIDAIFTAYWAEDRDISDRSVLAELASQQGLDGAALCSRIDDPTIKGALRAETDLAVRMGLCGAPSFVVGEDVFWGQDRLELVRRALTRR